MTNPTHITAQPGVPFVDLVREFDARREAVYKAHTDPDLFPAGCCRAPFGFRRWRWMRGQGGAWSYACEGEGNVQLYGFGVFHSVEPNKQFTHTSEFSFAPGHPTLSITRFEDLGGGRCRMSMREIYDTVESRDAAADGMDGAMEESFERLDEILAASATPA